MTKRLMKEALLDLLEQKELSGISVTAVCETANINRSTFYNYYSSPSDLLREIEQDVLDRIPALPPILDPQGEEQLLQATTAFFDYVKDNKRIFRVLFNKSENYDFSSRLLELLCSQYIRGMENRDSVSSRFVQHYIANGTVGMLREWVVSGFPIESREIAQMMYFLSRKITS
jgi:AcrR family transcriptional regulator